MCKQNRDKLVLAESSNYNSPYLWPYQREEVSALDFPNKLLPPKSNLFNVACCLIALQRYIFIFYHHVKKQGNRCEI